MTTPHDYLRLFQRTRLSTKAIVVLIALATASALVGALTDRFDNWAPNLTTEALFVALAVGVIDRILKHEERERLRPRLDRIEEIIRTEFAGSLEAIVHDYARAHPIEVRTIPLDSLRLIDLWIEGVRGGARSDWGPDGRPLVLVN